MANGQQASRYGESTVAKVFISYSRKDTAFVRDLAATLEKRGKDVWVDLDDIPLTAEWRAEIRAGIEGADVFVFVISPDSIASKECKRELDHATKHNKRLVPVLRRDVDPTTAPDVLERHNWIFFRETDDTEETLERLLAAMDTDLEWIKIHTRLLTRAVEWGSSESESRGRDRSLLLRGSDLSTAEEWQARAADKKPELTDLQVQYILASRGASTRRQRILLAAVTFGMIVAVVLGIFALLQRNEAIAQRNEATEQRNVALSRQLAAQSELVRNQETGQLERSVLLAAESLQRYPTLEADQALRGGLGLLTSLTARMNHEGGVLDVALSPDGELVATAGYDGKVRMWEVGTGREVSGITQGDYVEVVGFSPDGNRLITSGDGEAHVWDVSTRREVLSLSPDSGVEAVALSPDGSRLAASSDDEILVWDVGDVGTGDEVLLSVNSEGDVANVALSPDGSRLAAIGNKVRVWDVDTGDEILSMSPAERGWYLAFSPDGRYLATASTTMSELNGTGSLLDVDGRREVFRFEHRGDAADLAFSPGGKLLATAGADVGETSVWDVDTEREVSTVEGSVGDAAFSPDGKRLATGGDGEAHVWDVGTGREVSRLTHDDYVEDVAFSADGERLATAGTDGAILVWDVGMGGEVFSVSPEGFMQAADFSPDGRRLATGWFDRQAGAARVWDLITGRKVLDVSHPGNFRGVGDVALSPDGDLLATADIDGTARLWDVDTEREIPDMSHDADDVGGMVALSPDGDLVAAAGTDGTARVWDVGTERQVLKATHEDGVGDVALSPDGDMLATAGTDGTARVWDVGAGHEASVFTHGDSVKVVAFGPNGDMLATAGTDGTARVWDVGSGREILSVSHEGGVWDASLSPDGDMLATAGADGTARVWDVGTGREVSRLTYESAPGVASRTDAEESVLSVAFSPDGEMLLTATGDGTVQTGPWQPEDLIAQACSRLSRNLTGEEWQEYLGNEPYRKTCPNLSRPGG